MLLFIFQVLCQQIKYDTHNSKVYPIDLYLPHQMIYNLNSVKIDSICYTSPDKLCRLCKYYNRDDINHITPFIVKHKSIVLESDFQVILHVKKWFALMKSCI